MHENDLRYRGVVRFENGLIRIVMFRETAEDGYLRFINYDS